MKVLIADDHPTFRNGVKQVLKDVDPAVATVEAKDFNEVLDISAREQNIDMVLLDLMMPGMEPIEGLSATLARYPGIPVVVVSAIENRRDALQTIDLGAAGYIPKTVTEEEFVNMLRVVMAGGICLPRHFPDRGPTAAPSRSMEQGRFASGELLAGLTKRQRQVLALLAQGKSNIEIAEDLGVSDKTVRFYISAILKALKVRNRTQAALIAARAMESAHGEGLHDHR